MPAIGLAQASRALVVEEVIVPVRQPQPPLGEAREVLPVEYAGGAVEIGFNAQYLLDFLSVAGNEGVELQLKDSESQGLLRPAGDANFEHRYVVMPMRF